MLNRIALILQTQNLTVSAFADRIGVQRSALSHVLSGRNNPSLDFVTKILRTFPEIRSQWLLFGEGKMYDGLSCVSQGVSLDVRPVETAVLPGAETVLSAAEASAEGEFEAVELRPEGAASEAMTVPAESVQTEKTEAERPAMAAVSDMAAVGIEAVPAMESEAASAMKSEAAPALPDDFAPVQTDHPRLVKVVFFYSDGHFEEYAQR